MKQLFMCGSGQERLFLLFPELNDLTAAARQDQESDDDDPDAVVVVKKIAEAVIHNGSSVSESM